jgi:hypothetical protein
VTPNRKKAWVDELLTKKDPIERALGVPLETMLGCGHWGCVFESTAPWVVKLSIDPTEGPIWSKVAGLVEEEQYGGDGLVRIHSITRLTPDLVYGGKKRKVWAIVREGVEPVFREYRPKELGEKGRGTRTLTTAFTNELLGYSKPQSWSLEVTNYKQEDFKKGIESLFKYRDLTTFWHLKQRAHRGLSRTALSQGRYAGRLDMSLEATAERIQRVTEVGFQGPHMAPLGETLSMLASNGVFLRDVHNLNIGWHVPKDDDDWARVVIFDPGHTPTEGADIGEALLENREAL